MNDAAITYRLEHIDNLRYLLCLVQEMLCETGMEPYVLEYHSYTLAYTKRQADAVIKGAMTEDEYIAKNMISLPYVY